MLNTKILFSVILLILAALFFGLRADGVSPVPSSLCDEWLENLVGREIVVVFQEKPLGMGRTVKVTLLDIGSVGILVKMEDDGNDAGPLLKWKKTDMLFTYASIISIESAKKVKWNLYKDLARKEEQK